MSSAAFGERAKYAETVTAQQWSYEQRPWPHRVFGWSNYQHRAWTVTHPFDDEGWEAGKVPHLSINEGDYVLDFHDGHREVVEPDEFESRFEMISA